FVAYDGDGHTYAYEKGGYFRQEVSAKRSATSTEVALHAATGSYKPHFLSYLLRVHQASAAVTTNGATLKKFPSETAFRSSSEPGWVSSVDKFGAVTEVRVAAEAREQNVK